MKEVKITCGEQNQRLDKFLLKYFNKANKSFIYKMLRKKRIKYNGKKADGNEMLTENDILSMYLSQETMDLFMEESTVVVAKRHFGIIYEDDNVLIVDKPPGLLSHPEKDGDRETLIDQILYYLYEKGQYTPNKENTFIPAICNRLDRNTGGIVIAGKNLMAVQEVSRVIKEKKLDKYYMTMVKGVLDKPMEIIGYHSKDMKNNKVRVTKAKTDGAKKIITRIAPIQVKDRFSMLEIELVTGKSHQIRAHLKSMGYPVIGDRKYGDININRMFKEKYGVFNQVLFAYKIVWNDKGSPLGYLSEKELIAKLPEYMVRIKRDFFE